MVKPKIDLKGFEPKFEIVSSHLDSKDENYVPVLLNQKPLTLGQFNQEIYPVIYPSGLVMLNPRWTRETYNVFYTKYYDELYELSIKPDYGKEGIVRNMKEVWDRVTSRLNIDDLSINNILDAGCGPGYGLEYLKSLMSDIKLFGIESSEASRNELKKNNVTVLDSDIDGDWHKNNANNIDVIILRHVVEHMLDPIKSLSNLRTTLSSEGFMYIAVPDMMNPRTVLRDYTKWWEYWFRSVHTYYYSKETLFATLFMAGLEPIFFEEENEEIWCIVKALDKQKLKEFNINDTNTFHRQMEILRKFLP